jgi:hypothetical protein
VYQPIFTIFSLTVIRSPSANFHRVVSEIEIWRAANLLLKHYGHKAGAEAAARAAALRPPATARVRPSGAESPTPSCNSKTRPRRALCTDWCLYVIIRFIRWTIIDLMRFGRSLHRLRLWGQGDGGPLHQNAVPTAPGRPSPSNIHVYSTARHAPVVACKHIELVAQEGDIDRFFGEAFPRGNRVGDKLGPWR